MSTQPAGTTPQVKLAKRAGKDYPAVNDIFAVSYVPVPTEASLNDGELLVDVLYLSIDAAMRIWINGVRTYVDGVQIGDVMPAQGVARVVASRSAKFAPGDVILALVKWQGRVVIPARGAVKLPRDTPNPEHFLGVYGIAGQTAYFGMFEVAKPDASDTVVVSAAAGSVGEIAVQLARAHGCRVIGIAGGAEKCAYVVKTLGAEACIDYKAEKVEERLRALCPKGINVYFDNVGGEILDAVLMNIADGARIALCGAISQYNGVTYRLKNYPRLVVKRGKMAGFILFDYAKKYGEAIQHLQGLHAKKQLHFSQDFVDGVQNAPVALHRLLTGKNTGKVIVRATGVGAGAGASAKL